MKSLFLLTILIVPAQAVAEDDKSDLRTWTDSAGKYTVIAKFVEYKEGSLTLATSNTKVFKVQITRLSTPDQLFIKDKILNDKRAQHLNWIVRVAEVHSWQENDVWYENKYIGGGVYQNIPHIDYNHSHTVSKKVYVMKPVQARLVSYDHNDVTLQNDKTAATTNYANFSAADQKFLTEYRKLEKSFDLPDEKKTK